MKNSVSVLGGKKKYLQNHLLLEWSDCYPLIYTYFLLSKGRVAP